MPENGNGDSNGNGSDTTVAEAIGDAVESVKNAKGRAYSAIIDQGEKKREETVHGKGI